MGLYHENLLKAGRFVVFCSPDCLPLVQWINSSINDRSKVGVVVSDIKMLAAIFSSIFFRQVRRSLMVIAHILARSYEFDVSRVISYYAPECIRQTLCMDALEWIKCNILSKKLTNVRLIIQYYNKMLHARWRNGESSFPISKKKTNIDNMTVYRELKCV
jgi:hypothetical protein